MSDGSNLGGLFALPPARVVATAALPREALDGMALVEANTAPAWAELALATVREVACAKEHFTTDDVWERLDAQELASAWVHNNSALGPIMRKASASGWMVDTLTVLPSTRGSRHGNRLRVWKSTLYDKSKLHNGGMDQ